MANDEERNMVLLAAYAEVCKSYHAIDDFRTKLLGAARVNSGVMTLPLNDAIVFGRMTFINLPEYRVAARNPAQQSFRLTR